MCGHTNVFVATHFLCWLFITLTMEMCKQKNMCSGMQEMCHSEKMHENLHNLSANNSPKLTRLNLKPLSKDGPHQQQLAYLYISL